MFFLFVSFGYCKYFAKVRLLFPAFGIHVLSYSKLQVTTKMYKCKYNTDIDEKYRACV